MLFEIIVNTSRRSGAKTGLVGKWLLASMSVFSLPLQALEISGNVAAQAQWFPQQAAFAGQLDRNLTLSFEPKLRQQWNNGDDEVTLEIFGRADRKDDARNHADIRELKWLHVGAVDEWRIGIDSVFWGVTESRHLVDIINQTDRVEGLDGEDKLGQPMIHYTRIEDWGVLDLFVLSGFREPAYHSSKGRLRFALPVDDSQTQFESSDGDGHIDFALRYSQTFGDTDLGLSWFSGTNRDAAFSVGQDSNGQPVLIPFYSQIDQFSLDMQSIVEDWIWKLEMIARDSETESYIASTFGFEYTFYGILDSAIDLGTLMEYSWENREQNAGIFDNDLFTGLRFAFNDVQSSEILAGIFYDTRLYSRSFRLEASRRIGDSWKLSVETQIFSGVNAADPLNAFAADDYLQLELARYF